MFIKPSRLPFVSPSVKRRPFSLPAALVLCAAGLAGTIDSMCGGLVPGLMQTAKADEGMYLLNAPPTALIKEKYNYTLTPQFLENMQKSAVRLATGGSGSLVSATGLVMTNHHVGRDMLLKLSTPEKDIIKDGFIARTHAEELKCPDLIIDILWEIEDVTDRVNASAKDAADDATAGTARRKAIAEIEKASKDATGLKSQVVTLYQGGKYHLYRYRSYSDVRLVFAPESSIAAFGGDTDNFEFPRHCLDMCFFRIYDGDKPLVSTHHLSWSKAGANENDLVFVFGHPGRTRRMYTTDHLRFLRDIQLPFTMNYLWRSEIKYQSFSARNAENARIAKEDLGGIANARKAYTGLLAGLQDPALFGRKIQRQQELITKLNADPDLSEKYGDAWDNISEAQSVHEEIFQPKYLLDRLIANSALLSRAMHIVRLAEELQKPNEQRLPEYGEAGLEDLYTNLYSPEPIHDALEVERLTQLLSWAVEYAGSDEEIIVEVLDGKSPRARAADLVARCTFKDPQARKTLVEAGESALDNPSDPVIQLAMLLDEHQRAIRTQFEDEVQSVERANYAKIAAASFAIYGDTTYPDATFTLRLAYGTVKGQNVGSTTIKPFTTIGGTFELATRREADKEFTLPPSWKAAKESLDLSTPFNFICTADVIGGNSGSPVVNGEGQVVGLIFDGNLDSLVGDVIFDTENARSVSVDSRGMLESLRKVYKTNELVAELTGSTAKSTAK